MAEAFQYDPRFVEGVRHFNACDFYEAHEVWEDLWADYQGPSRRFYQGLIQVAVCLHHFGNENTRGAVKLYHGCQTYLNEYRPRHEGVDLEKLLGDLERCCGELLSTDEPIPTAKIVPDLIPEIHLDPPPEET